MGTKVVRLGAWCDFVSEDEFGISFRVSEFAVLSDGRHVTLHSDRGFDTGTQGGGRAPVDPWAELTIERLQSDVRTAVLSDDAEESGEEHPWEWLGGLLRVHGVLTSPEELGDVPYDVVFSERLRSRLVADA